MAPHLTILGIAQDGGYPHAGCRRSCCRRFYDGKEPQHLASCLGLVDPASGERWLFDCTPDFPAQLHMLSELCPGPDSAPAGIFLTHAHIGHYAGLMYLGKEVMNAKRVPVYGRPDMLEFLSGNAPWRQLVDLGNVDLRPIQADVPVELGAELSVQAFDVPHRAEYTSTVGYRIASGRRSALYIPDVDKWSKWECDIAQIVREADLAFLDGTFFHAVEFPGRTMADVPHPFIEETMAALADLPASARAGVHFIHLNHTNPALLQGSDAQREIEARGFHLAREGQKHEL